LYRFPCRTAIDKIDSSRAFPSAAFSNIFKKRPEMKKFLAKGVPLPENICRPRRGPTFMRIYHFLDFSD